MRFLIFGAVLLAGCASSSTITSDYHLPLGQTAICVPPAMPDFTEWKGVRGQVVSVEDESGKPRVAIVQGYKVRDEAVLTFWVDGVLVWVDPAPSDSDVPTWVDQGAANAERTVRAVPQQSCRWKKVGGASA